MRKQFLIPAIKRIRTHKTNGDKKLKIITKINITKNKKKNKNK